MRTLYEVCQQQSPDQDDLFFTSFTVTILMRCWFLYVSFLLVTSTAPGLWEPLTAFLLQAVLDFPFDR